MKSLPVIIKADGKVTLRIHAVIYVREAFKQTICFLDKDVQVSRMSAFNKNLYQS